MNQRERFNRRLTARQDKGDEFGFTNRYKEGVQRIMAPSGDFNVIRVGEKKLLFHELLTMQWWKFLLFIVLFYSVVNLLFAKSVSDNRLRRYWYDCRL